uniref:T-box domain-containing protein n=1 Tax=Caenorhabditis tropicalis TaxID=1561998 RepID=A0A1I7V2D7_9PELO
MSYQLSSGSLTVTLLNENLYESIRPVVMEQVITRRGRMFFPEPIFKFDGLDPDSVYKMAIRFDKISDYKLKYKDGKFEETKTLITLPIQSATYHHPNTQSAILLVQKGDGNPLEFRFEPLQFIAVTTYYRKEIIEFKSKNNKYSSKNAKQERKLKKEAEIAKIGNLKKPLGNSTKSNIPNLHITAGPSVSNLPMNVNFSSNVPIPAPAIVPTLIPAQMVPIYPQQNMFNPPQTTYQAYPYMNQNQPPIQFPNGPVFDYHQNQFLQQFSNVHPQYYPAQNPFYYGPHF